MDDKYYFLGYWYPTDKIVEELDKLRYDKDEVTSDTIDLTLESLAKDDPESFAILCKSLYKLRQQSSLKMRN